MSVNPSPSQIEEHMHLLRQWMAPTQFATYPQPNRDLFSQLQYAQTYPAQQANDPHAYSLPLRSVSYQQMPFLPPSDSPFHAAVSAEEHRQGSITPLSCPSGDGGGFDDVSSRYSEAPSSYLSSDFPEFPSWDDTSNTAAYTLDDTSNTTLPDTTTSPTTVQPTTEVDALMMCFKTDSQSLALDENATSRSKKHPCPEPGCMKSFSQMTHLKIHHRSHTGEKPYVCSVTGCGQSFSQLGNLRTHERRHLGQKPNRTRAASASGRYECRLDSCAGKPFTQLGNLKSHQNKFHKQTLINLSNRFANIDENQVAPEERELMIYFQDLYKNSNKGIKGRGKGRKVEVLRFVE